MKNSYLSLSLFLLTCLLLPDSVFAQCVPPAAPTAVTATPDTTCINSSISLNGTSAGNDIYWYTVPTGGIALGMSASGVNFSTIFPGTTTYYAESQVPAGGSQTFTYTGAMQTFTVPANITTITVDCYGAEGIGMNGFLAGKGGKAMGDLTVTPGQIINVYVGGQALFNGGGSGQGGANGGDASDVRVGGTTLSDRVIVAGGGGGAGGDNWQCLTGTGDGGGGTAVGANFVGGAGGAGYTSGTGCGTNGGNLGGTGGSGTHGGGGGGGGASSGGTGASSQVGVALSGILGIGGDAFFSPSCGATGGGGGGYYGGGGAAGNNCGAGRGGGGASWTGTLANPTFSSGIQSGNGQIVISWVGVGCASATRTPVTVTTGTPPPPSSATANPSNFCAGATVQLSAISSGGGVTWFTAPTGGVSIGSSASGANFAVTPPGTTTYYAETVTGSVSGSQTFAYTGAQQTFVVPAGVTSVDVDATGGKGGDGTTGVGGNGGRIQTTITVTPGQTMYVYVGGAGGSFNNVGGYNGGANNPTTGFPTNVGGGGGASDIRLGGAALSNRAAVAGGGGAGGYNGCTEDGGAGGGLIGAAGTIGCGSGASGGGTQSAGGIGGTYPGFNSGLAGALGLGGEGASGTAGSGGGGGYYGGGGGSWEGGGGGSSYSNGVNTTHTQGYNAGNGQIILSWAGFAGCNSATRTPVTVTLDNTVPAAPTNTTASPNTTCLGGVVQLSAISSGNSIQWYDAATGGTLLGTSASGANFTVTPSVTTTYYSQTLSTCTGLPSLTRDSVLVTLGIIPPPTAVTANPDPFCLNAPVQLNGTTGAGNLVNWFTVSTGGTSLGISASGANFAVNPTATTTYYAETLMGAGGVGGSQTFSYTGSLQNFTVPAGITSVTINAKGAQGGAGGTAVLGSAGLGANMTGTFTVTPGQILTVLVGQQGGGSSGTAGAGGGGGSFVTDNSNTPMIIAGGGGGRHGTLNPVGMDANTGTSGSDGYSDASSPPYPANDGIGGINGNGATGGNPHAGNGGGLLTDGATAICGGPGFSFLTGGAGGTSCTSNIDLGGFGGGGGGGNNGAGGAGGYSGGGGSYHTPTNGGGGGSYNNGTSQTNLVNQTGNGEVVFTWSGNGCSSSVRTPVTVTLDNTVPAAPTGVTASPSTFCIGGSINLSATSAGNSIEWYDVPTGGVSLGSSASGANFYIIPPGTTTYYAQTISACSGLPSTTRSPVTATVGVILPPTGVTANPGVFCPGGTVQLNATAVGNFINWYTVPTGGVILGTSNSGTNFAVTPPGTTTYYAETSTTGGGVSGSQTFAYTGVAQTFTVPGGVTSLTIDAYGAEGIGMNGFTPGQGGRAKGDLIVTPGQVLNVYVGGQALFNGGGAGKGGANGGDASDVRAGGNAIPNRVIVAGGGGGAGGDNWSCFTGTGDGGGGTAVGTNAVGGGGGSGYSFCGANGGNTGGTSSNATHGGGGGGGGFTSGGVGAASAIGTALSGALGQGGDAYFSASCTATGGGGGGYYGGGGAAGNNCGAGQGGGGSSWTGTLTNPLFAAGVRVGNGQILISWIGNPGCTSSTRTPVTVTVDNIVPAITWTGGTQAVSLGANCTGFMPNYTASPFVTASDNCAAPTITQSPIVGAAIPAGVSLVTLTATDAAGNTATTTFNINAADLTPPTISWTGGQQSVLLGAGCMTIMPDYTNSPNVSATDNCTAPTVTQIPAPGIILNIGGNITITLIATDAGGNADTTTFIMVAVDSNSPVLTVPGTQTVNLDSMCHAFVPNLLPLSSATDNCSNVTLSQSPISGAAIFGSAPVTVIVTATDGSNNTDFAPVTINPIPYTPSVYLGGPTTFCQGDNVVLTSPTYQGYIYQWYENGAAITGANGHNYTAATSGSYYVVITMPGACVMTATPVAVTVTAVNVLVTQNSSTLTAAATGTGTTYQWINCNGNVPISGATAQSFTPTANGNYAVIIGQSDCTDTSSCIAVTSVGIVEGHLSHQIKTYPNPTSGMVTIDLGSDYPAAEVKVISLIGALISTGNYSHTQMLQVEMPETDGVYFVTIKLSNGESATVRVVKE